MDGEVKRSFNLGQFGQITDKLPIAKRRNLKKLEQVEQSSIPEPSPTIVPPPPVAPSPAYTVPFAMNSISVADFSLLYDDLSASFDIFDTQSMFYD